MSTGNGGRGLGHGRRRSDRRGGTRLTFFGSSLVSAYWNGAATYYRGLLRALHGRGYAITFCEPDAYDRQEHRDLTEDPSYARVAVYRSEAERDRLLAEAFRRSDWVIKCSGVGVWDNELERAVAEGSDASRGDIGRGGGEAGGARTAFWDVDAPATLGRIDGNADDPFRAALPCYDHVFTYGGGPPIVERYETAGARRCTPIYNALDPAEHRPVEGVARRWDLLFMGNRLPDREERVRRFFIEVAERCPEHRFALGGEGWGDAVLPPNVERLGHVPTGDHNLVNAAARLVLNIHRQSMVDNGYSPATRMFEAAGAAACQVTDAWEGIERFFEPGREILVAPDGEAVARAVREVDETRAREVGLAARARALEDHTYASRAEEVDAVLRSYGTVRV